MARYLHELLEGWVDDAPQIRLSGLSLDGRAIEAGEAYVALDCQAIHARCAVQAGAVAVIHDGKQELPRLDVPTIRINGLAHKLGELASRYYAAPSELMTIAGVTGGAGRSSVAHYLAQSWQRVYGNAGVVGTLGGSPVNASRIGRRTTPGAIELQQVLAGCADSGLEHLALEVSSRALKQKQLETVQFDAAVFTDSGASQSYRREAVSGYNEARRLLFTDHAPSFAVINRDDAHGRRWISELDAEMQVLSFGLEKGVELRADVLNHYSNGTCFRIDGPWGSERVYTSLRGEASMRCLLATAGTLALLGMPWHRVLHQLEVMEPLAGKTANPRRARSRRPVFTGYAQQPDTLEVAA